MKMPKNQFIKFICIIAVISMFASCSKSVKDDVYVNEEENSIANNDIVINDNILVEATDFTWNLDDSGTLTISGNGAMPDWEIGGTPWQDKMQDILSIKIEEGITTVGKYAFAPAKNVTSVIFPETLIKINGYAFSNCNSLKSIVLPNNLKEIGESTFSLCSELTIVEIPSSVESIGDSAFSCCYKLKNLVLSEGLLKIETDAFNSCTVLEHVYIPASVIEITGGIFNVCHSLSSVEISSNNKNYILDDGVIYNADKSILVNCLPNKVGVFKIPETVKQILPGAFHGSNDLSGIILPKGLSVIEKETFRLCARVEKFEIPYGVEKIGVASFKECASATEIIIPETVKEIDDMAFYMCNSLSMLKIPENTTIIGKDILGFSSNTVLQVKEGSVAYEYAIANGLDYELY